jgi:hypothetical protein
MRGPGGESPLAVSDRATPGCLAHQSEAPPGWIQRRDFLEQCSLAKVRSGVRGSRVRAEEQSSCIEIPDRWKAPRFVGRHRSSRSDVGSESRLVCARRMGVSSPFAVPFPRPGCSRAAMRRGARIRASPSLTSSRPVPERLRSPRCGSLRCGVPPQRNGVGTAVSLSDEDRTLVRCARAS